MNKVPPTHYQNAPSLCETNDFPFLLNTLTWLLGSPSRLHICGTILLSVNVWAPELKTKGMLYWWWKQKTEGHLPYPHHYLSPRLTPFPPLSASKINTRPKALCTESKTVSASHKSPLQLASLQAEAGAWPSGGSTMLASLFVPWWFLLCLTHCATRQVPGALR